MKKVVDKKNKIEYNKYRKNKGEKNMNKKTVITFVLFYILGVIVVACNTSYESMMDIFLNWKMLLVTFVMTLGVGMVEDL